MWAGRLRYIAQRPSEKIHGSCGVCFWFGNFMKGQSRLKENWKTAAQKTVDSQFLHLIQLSLRCFCQMCSCQSKQDFYFYIFRARNSCKLKQFKHQRKVLVLECRYIIKADSLSDCCHNDFYHHTALLQHLSKNINNINPPIAFMSEKERDGKLLLLDTCVHTKIDGTVYDVQRGAAGR